MGGVGGQQRARVTHPAGSAVDRGGQVDDVQATEHALVDQVEYRSASPVVVAVAAVVIAVGTEVKAHSQVAGGGGDVPHVAGLLGGAQVHGAPAGQGVRVGQEGRGTVGLRGSVRSGRGGGAAHEQLAAHAQVGRQGTSVVQGQPQELPTADGRGQGAPGELVDEGLRSPVLAAQRTRIEDLDAGDGASGHVPGETGAHHLDLGQLWHQLVWGVCPVSRSARRASLTPGRLRPPSPRAARMAA